MFTVDWFKNKRVTVMGLGVHGGGLGVAKWLRAHGACVTVTDLRDRAALRQSIDALEGTHPKGLPRITYVLGSHPKELFSDTDLVIQNPAVPRDNALLAHARKHKVPVETDISLFFQLCPFPIAAISGTKGKTTTTVLLSEMAKRVDKRAVVGGNIRISPLDKLDALLAAAAKRNAKPVPIVLELSSWQLEGLAPHKLSPHVGVLTMIAEDHLNRYNGMADYASAKEIIVAHQRAGDTAVLNFDNDWNRAIGERRGALREDAHGGRRLWYSFKRLPASLNGAYVDGTNLVLRDGGKRIVLAPVKSVGLPGAHNVSNVLAAAAAAYAMGIPLKDIRHVIKTLKGVPYRLETVGIKRGMRFVNDTAATAPDASIAAMATYATKASAKPHVILLAGGADKELSFDAWAAAVKKARLKHLVLFSGTALAKIHAALDAVGDLTPRTVVLSMADAFGVALAHSSKGDVILLSPGTASFGIFKNEFDRGDQFTALVKKLR